MIRRDPELGVGVGGLPPPPFLSREGGGGSSMMHPYAPSTMLRTHRIQVREKWQSLWMPDGVAFPKVVLVLQFTVYCWR